MRVRAIAKASAESNAVGTLELECTAHGLAVVYLDVGPFADGYATPALTSKTQLLIPWTGVKAARAEGEQVFLEFHSELTPLNRITLAHFSTGDGVHHRELYRQRLVLRIASFAAAVVAVVATSLTVPKVSPASGARAALLLAAFAGLAILAVGFVLDRFVASGGREGDEVRRELVADLSRYLSHLVQSPQAAEPKPKPRQLPDLAGFLPRTTTAIAITLSAIGLGSVLMGRWLLHNEQPTAREVEVEAPPEAPAPLAPQPAAAQPPAQAPAAAAPRPSTPSSARGPGKACACARADSPLWQRPVPKLSTLVLSRAERFDTANRKHLELDIAAVNNGADDLRELSLMLEFFEQDPPPSKRRYSVATRALYFEGPLGPGKAIKWDVEARGSEFTISNPVEGDIGPGGDGAAPTNLLAELLDANHRPVRLHGAMMLAYLGDPRAREATLKLKEALREEEAPYLERILFATAELRVCQIQASASGSGSQIRACVFNASREVKRDVGVKARALTGPFAREAPTALPPTISAETSWRVPGEIPPGSGVETSGRLDAPSDSPIELLADRHDLLP